MTNAQWLIRHGIRFTELTISYSVLSDQYEITHHGRAISRVPAFTANETFAFQTWLEKEHCNDSETLLTPEELKYLTAVIEPFQEKVYAFHMGADQRLQIWWEDYNGYCGKTILPVQYMFHGLKAETHYDPKTLGITGTKEEE